MLSFLAIVFLTLVGYSSGVALTVRGGHRLPAFGELLLIVVLWSLALFIRASSGHWLAIAGAVLMGLVAGAVATTMFMHETESISGPRQVRHAGVPRTSWGRWQRFAVRMGNFQSRLLMGFFYFGIVTPFALLSRLAHDPLDAPASDGSFWAERADSPLELDASRNQF